MEFKSMVIFVKNIQTSKEFYINNFGLGIEMDFGTCISFTCGLALWSKEYAFNMLTLENSVTKSHNFELYFEKEDLDGFFDDIKEKNILFLHKMKEQPWGQRCIRIFDPDKNIVEIAEPMFSLIKRLKKENLSNEQIAKKTLMPLEIVKTIK